MKIAALVLVAVLASFTAVNADFVGAFLPNTPAGYQLATFQDIVGNDFVNQYNTIGISFVAPYGGPVCCAVRVQEGFLTFAGGVGGYLENFVNGTDCCTTGTSPSNTTLGVPPFASSPFEGTWLKQLDAKAISLLGVNSSVPPTSFATCGAGVMMTAFFKKIGPAPPPPTTTTQAPQVPYIIAPYGPDYARPNGYRRMQLNDFMSTAFTNFYNTNGIRLIGNYTSNYCCMLQLQDGGWLTYGAENNFSPLSLFINGMWSCGAQAMGNLVTIGTSFGGPHDNTLFPTLNSSTMMLIGEFYNNTRNDFDGCQNLADSLTMWTLE